MPDEHSYVEIANDSRAFEVTNSGITQTLMLGIVLDHTNTLPYEDDDTDYTFLNASDDVVALKFAYSVFPEFRYCPSYSLDKKVLVLDNISLTQKGPRHWMATGKYTFNVNTGSGGERPEEGKNTLPFVRVNFNIGGGTKRVYKSDEVLGVEKSDDAPAEMLAQLEPFHGAIGVTSDSIEGTDVPDSDLRIQITAYFKPDYITIDFMKTLRDVIAGSTNKGSYNDDVFLGCEEGEVQLRGITGGARVVDIVPMTFDFHIGKNLSDQEDEGFPNIPEAFAHDIIDYIFWPVWKDGVKKMLMVPQMRVIHRVAQPADYTLMEIPEDDG